MVIEGVSRDYGYALSSCHCYVSHHRVAKETKDTETGTGSFWERRYLFSGRQEGWGGRGKDLPDGLLLMPTQYYKSACVAK